MLLCDFISHCPRPGSCGGNRSIQPQGEASLQAFFRWAKVCTSRALQFRQSSFHLIMRVLQDRTLQRLRVFPALMTCSVPVSLSASGKSLAQEHSSEFFLSVTGILQCVKWRTRFTLQRPNTFRLCMYQNTCSSISGRCEYVNADISPTTLSTTKGFASIPGTEVQGFTLGLINLPRMVESSLLFSASTLLE